MRMTEAKQADRGDSTSKPLHAGRAAEAGVTAALAARDIARVRAATYCAAVEVAGHEAPRGAPSADSRRGSGAAAQRRAA